MMKKVKIFSAEQIKKTYGDKQLFNQISFHIEEKEKIGLIGVNGTGKSSLLKLIAGMEEIDAGEFRHPKDYKITFLPQEPELNPSLSILDQVFESDIELIRLVHSYEKALVKLEKTPENQQLQEQLFQLQKRMDEEDGWNASVQAKTILSKLGIVDVTEKIGHLSGGQKKRVALAQVLIDQPDLLLLDEPTNHLDYETIKWLEGFINQNSKAILYVTHDRYFLDQTASRILELANGSLYSYQGNYESYLEAKAAREEEAVQAEIKKKNLYRRELAWINRGAKARSTKQKARIQRFEELESQLGNNSALEQVDISLQGSRLGKQVFELINASFSFGGKTILSQFDLLVKPSDRIGIVGKNGSGKSTLLNLLAGRTSLDAGQMIVGKTVKIAYYTQEIEDIDEDKRIISYIREAGEVVETSQGEKISAPQMLERFLFPLHTHGTLIRRLSGGEKRRLYLLKLLMSKPNVLLLDEPTNDLDTETLTVLEQYIEEFPGVVISVSHDRYFLDKTAEQLMIFKGEGLIEKYYGSYSDYLEDSKLKDDTPEQPSKSHEQPHPRRPLKKNKMTYKEQKEWETIEDRIAGVEESISLLNEELNSVGADFVKAEELMEQIQSQQDVLEELITRWTYLSELTE